MRVFTAAACLDHEPGPSHPERPARLAAVTAALAAAGHAPVEAAAAAPEPLLAVHDGGYLERVAAMSARGRGDFGADTPVGPASWAAATAAAGAALAALEYGLAHGGAFAAIRPPGHHALRDTAMGFCFVNHAAVLAADAARRGLERILIVDWDVHHGNGTQALVERDPRVRFVSMHQWPWYPGTGAADEVGVGNCFNVPQPPGLRPEVYVEALWGGIRAATDGWTPQLVLLSAGYDAMRGDPLGGFTLEPGHYAEWVARIGDRCAGAPLVGLMEGGYVPDRLAAGVTATVRAMAAR